MPRDLGVLERLLWKDTEPDATNLPPRIITVGVSRDCQGSILHGYIADRHGNPYAEHHSIEGFGLRGRVAPFAGLSAAYHAFMSLSTGAEQVNVSFNEIGGFVYRRTRDYANSGRWNDQICANRYMTYERVPHGV
ncbi:hypothetical protein HY642_02230 [Candidatus Woesearchaeota archaeon]|nr:hypothetical protein [Candidatus Woesearchaeota archaeon]